MNKDKLLRGRAAVEKQIADDADDAVVRKVWAKFYEPLNQDEVRALIELKRLDGSYLLARDGAEHDVARSYWRQARSSMPCATAWPKRWAAPQPPSPKPRTLWPSAVFTRPT